MRHVTSILLAAVLLLPAHAFAQDMGSMPGMESPADKALMEVNERMMRAMQVRPSGDADRDFASMMLGHHQGAVDMAKVELQYGKDAELRALAETIIAAQEKEIARLQAWLAKRT